ncbi:50S ribosomal protein L11 [Rhabdochlamydiaceae symbiont of Dictyostelium giganteum]|uniref:50S ribosomal protein L11 n=1 Tax=Rhabdochlamydiaceae symbiont of Dictyostelium giganteum TaxID=3342349 RepID=UPI00384BDE21
MAKTIVKTIKLQIIAGKANPAPPIGPALGAAQVNIMAFCKEFNARTQEIAKQTPAPVVPVVISVFSDKTFTFVMKESPTSRLILKEAGIEAGSKVPNRDKVAKLTKQQVTKIAEQKRVDMRVRTLEAAERLVAGTARSMGVDIIEG